VKGERFKDIMNGGRWGSDVENRGLNCLMSCLKSPS
jgi:hypothetical protein